MSARELRKKSMAELQEHLMDLRKEHFGLRMQHGTGESAKSHLLGQKRKEIARVKTIVNELKKAGKGE